MTLILNGTDNSATTPAVTGTDTDTGVYYPAANQVALATNGTQAMIVNATQQVGIGVAPSVRFQVLGAASGATCIFGVGTNGNGGIVWRNATDNSVGYTQVNSDNVEYRTTNDSTGAYLQKAGITFPTTQFASSNANTLDDYEEGEATLQFADAASGGNAYNVVARYIKIGRMVFLNWSAYYQSTPTWTAGNDIFVRGLPFATQFEGSGGAIMLRYSGSNATAVYLWQPSSQTYFVLKFMDFDNGVKGSNMPSSLTSYANICYLTGS
jgi:hypothetical protein